MTRLVPVAAFLALFALCPHRLTAAPPTTMPAVVGRVIAEADKPLPEMIVYLESADARQQFPAPTEHAVLSQKGARFTPSLLIVAVGQAVDFRNDETRPIEHNVFSPSPAKPFDLGLYRPPENRSVTFDKPGVVRLFCSIHRYMDGVIYVAPTPFFANVAADGKFSIPSAPPGEYRLKTWQRKQRYAEQDLPVTVAANSSATIELNLAKK
jgi:plastocyanin